VNRRAAPPLCFSAFPTASARPTSARDPVSPPTARGRGPAGSPEQPLDPILRLVLRAGDPGCRPGPPFTLRIGDDLARERAHEPLHFAIDRRIQPHTAEVLQAQPEDSAFEVIGRLSIADGEWL
jgi:hypothetical protein